MKEIKKAKEGTEGKLFTSAWKITINSNQERYKGTWLLFQSLIRRLALSKMMLNFFKVSKDPQGEYSFPSVEDFDGLIDKMTIEGAFEVGDTMHRLHAHLIVSILHFDYFQLDYLKLRHWFIRESDGKIRPNILAPLLPSSGTAARRYLNKDYGRRNQFRITGELRELDGSEKFYDNKIGRA